MTLFFWIAFLLAGAPQGPGAGVVEGVVLKSRTIMPVPDAKVVLELTVSVVERNQGRLVTLNSTPMRVETVTDGLGRFAFRGVPASVFTVTVSRDGFLESRLSRGVQAGERVELPPIQLAPAGTIAGQVLDEDRKPVAGAPVEFLKLERDAMGRRLWRRATTWVQTDENGAFKSASLALGTYYIRAIRRLPSGFRLDTYYPGSTDPNTAAPIVITEHQNVLADIHLRKDADLAPRKVSGKVASSLSRTASSPSIVVRLKQGLEHAPLEESEPLVMVSTIADDDSGEFEFREVLPGIYDLEVVAPVGLKTVFGRMPLQVLDEDVRELTVFLKAGVEVKGRIVVDDDGTRNRVRRAQPSRLSLVRRDRVANLNLSTTIGITEGITLFAFENVAEGVYDIDLQGVAMAIAGSSYISDVRRGGQSIFDVGLQVGADAIEDIEILVGIEGGSISGTLSSKDFAAAHLILVPQGSRRANALYRRQLVPLTSDSAPFTMAGVPPGDYKLFAVADNGETVPYLNSDFLAQYESRSVPVTVRKSQVSATGQLPVLPR